MDPRIDEAIEFWFGTEAVPTQAITARWYKRDEAFDTSVRERFGRLVEAAASGELAGWRGTPRSELALLLALDQFPRNMYRDDPRAYAQDGAALALAREMLGSGRSRRLTFHQRAVALLPFQHSEDRSVQEESVLVFKALLSEAEHFSAGPDILPALTTALDYAKKHQSIVDRFGRFPHRNAVLGRESTPAEQAFLKEPGSSF